MKKMATLGVLAALATMTVAAGSAEAGFFSRIKKVVGNRVAAAAKVRTLAGRKDPKRVLNRSELLKRLRSSATAIRARLRAARKAAAAHGLRLAKRLGGIGGLPIPFPNLPTVRRALPGSVSKAKRLFHF